VVYTFGSPRTGGQAFFDDYSPRLGNTTFRLVDGTDIVATVPLSLPGIAYRHVGQAVQCKSGGLFDGVAPMATDDNKPELVESATESALADFDAVAALELVQNIGPGPRNQLSRLLPRMIRDHIPASYFRALSVKVPAG
jgi:triacylglycerol lipase